MQVQLHILTGVGNPARNRTHGFIAEIGGLQRLDEERCTNPGLGQAVEQEAEPVLAAVDSAQNDWFGYRGQRWIGEIPADAEFRVDGEANLGRPLRACDVHLSLRDAALR